jgi:GYD domain
LANATAATFFGLRASNPRSHGAALALLDGLLDDRGGAQHQQLAQVLVTGTADLAAPLPAGSRVLARRDPDPRGKVPARAEHLRVRHFEREAQPADRADPGDRRQQLAGLILPVPRHQPRLDRLQLGLQLGQLAGERADHLARQRRHALRAGQPAQQLGDLLGSVGRGKIETVGRQACEAVGGKLVGGWYCFGEYDAVFICDVPDNESMSAIALAVAAGGAIKAAKTTVLMTGTEGVGDMKKADAVTRTYKPAR